MPAKVHPSVRPPIQKSRIFRESLARNFRLKWLPLFSLLTRPFACNLSTVSTSRSWEILFSLFKVKSAPNPNPKPDFSSSLTRISLHIRLFLLLIANVLLLFSVSLFRFFFSSEGRSFDFPWIMLYLCEYMGVDLVRRIILKNINREAGIR